MNRDKVLGFENVSRSYRTAFAAVCGEAKGSAVKLAEATMVGGDWLEFEAEFNLVEWWLRCKDMVESRLRSLEEEVRRKEVEREVERAVGEKRAREEEEGGEEEQEGGGKRAKVEHVMTDVAASSDAAPPVAAAVAAPLPQSAEKHCVVVNDVKWPAHPTTVAVSNLLPETHENDIVDLFKKTCELVHVRIIRDKRTKVSSGKAFVQFSTPGDVEKAMLMHDEMGVNGKVVHVERSRFPAIAVVTNTAVIEKKGGKEKKGDKKGETKGEKLDEEKVVAAPVVVKKKAMFRPSKAVVKKAPKLGLVFGAAKEEKGGEGAGGGGDDGKPKENAAFAAMFK